MSAIFSMSNRILPVPANTLSDTEKYRSLPEPHFSGFCGGSPLKKIFIEQSEDAGNLVSF